MSSHEIGAGEGVSPEDHPFYQSILKDLAQGKTVAAFQASPPDAVEPEITLLRHYETSVPRAVASAHPSRHMCAFGAFASQKVARKVAEAHGYEPEVA